MPSIYTSAWEESYALMKEGREKGTLNNKKAALIEKRQAKLFEMTQRNRPRFIRSLYRIFFC